MRFLVGTTKTMQTQIVHNSQNYSIIKIQLYFQGRDGVFRQTIKKGETSFFCMNFMMGSMEVTLRDKSQQKRFCKQVITSPSSSRMPMIIVRVLFYVKLMHKGLLWMAFYTPIPFLGPFEKRGIDLMKPLLMTRRGHRFIMVAIDYFTKFVKTCVLKSLMK